MAAAARDGAATVPDIDVVYRHAQDAAVDDLLRCDALLVATSENFGSLAGMTKDFFERVFYPCEHRVEGRPYSVLVCAGSDGSGAMFQTDRIATGLRMRKVLPGLVHVSGTHRADRRPFLRPCSRSAPKSAPRSPRASRPASTDGVARVPIRALGAAPLLIVMRIVIIRKCRIDHAIPKPPDEAAPGQDKAKPAPRRHRAAAELFAGAREIVIDHDGRLYQLRITQNGKLILTA